MKRNRSYREIKEMEEKYMRAEEKMILLGVLSKRSEEEEAIFSKLFTKKLDWAWIVGTLVRHRVNGNFVQSLDKEHRKMINPKILSTFDLLSRMYEAINIQNLHMCEEIFANAQKRNLKIAGLKGVVFNTSLYSLKTRMSNDIDILVAEKDIKQFDVLMRELGFIQSLDGGISEATRKEKLIQIMNYHDLVPYYKKVNEMCMDKIKVDVNFHFDSKEHDITEEIIKYGTVEYKGNGFCVEGLDWRTHLLHLCAHYYREATGEIWKRDKRYLDLYKLVDIENTFRRIDDSRMIYWCEVVKEFGMEDACYYTVNNLIEFYPSSKYREIMLELSCEHNVVTSGNIYKETFERA